MAVLSEHVIVRHDIQPDLFAEAEQVFAPEKPKAVKANGDGSNKPKSTGVKTSTKRGYG